MPVVGFLNSASADALPRSDPRIPSGLGGLHRGGTASRPPANAAWRDSTRAESPRMFMFCPIRIEHEPRERLALRTPAIRAHPPRRMRTVEFDYFSPKLVDLSRRLVNASGTPRKQSRAGGACESGWRGACRPRLRQGNFGGAKCTPRSASRRETATGNHGHWPKTACFSRRGINGECCCGTINLRKEPSCARSADRFSPRCARTHANPRR